jgi:hypothetical protein
MADLDPATIFAPRFNALGAPWAATGAIASIIYGEVRTTADINIIILFDPRSIIALEEVFPQSEFYRPPRDDVELEQTRDQHGHFNLIHFDSGFKADVYVSTRDPLHKWAIRNRKLVEIEGAQLWLAPPEYVIIRKLEFYREGGSDKHLRDIRGMLLATEVDKPFLKKEIEARALQEVWDAVRQGGADRG